MPQLTSTKVTNRFGPRYGKRNRLKYANMEISHRSTHDCPYCKYNAVRRISVGIWECKKCNSTFTGKAYSPSVQKVKKEETTSEFGLIEEKEKTAEEMEDDNEPGVKAPDSLEPKVPEVLQDMGEAQDLDESESKGE